MTIVKGEWEGTGGNVISSNVLFSLEESGGTMTFLGITEPDRDSNRVLRNEKHGL